MPENCLIHLVVPFARIYVLMLISIQSLCFLSWSSPGVSVCWSFMAVAWHGDKQQCWLLFPQFFNREIRETSWLHIQKTVTFSRRNKQESVVQGWAHQSAQNILELKDQYGGETSHSDWIDQYVGKIRHHIDLWMTRMENQSSDGFEQT